MPYSKEQVHLHAMSVYRWNTRNTSICKA